MKSKILNETTSNNQIEEIIEDKGISSILYSISNYMEKSTKNILFQTAMLNQIRDEIYHLAEKANRNNIDLLLKK